MSERDLFKADGSESPPDAPQKNNAKAGQSGTDYYKNDGTGVSDTQPPLLPETAESPPAAFTDSILPPRMPGSPSGFNPYQQDVYGMMSARRPGYDNSGMRPGQVWTERSGPIRINETAVPGYTRIEMFIPNAYNQPGGPYDFRYAGGQNYNLQHFVWPQAGQVQPAYDQYRQYYAQGAHPHAPTYYGGYPAAQNYTGFQQFRPEMNSSPNNMIQAEQALAWVIQSFLSSPGYANIVRGTNSGLPFYPEQPLGYRQPHQINTHRHGHHLPNPYQHGNA